MTPAPLHRVRVPADWEGVRLDAGLTKLLPGLSRTRVQEWIRDGGVRVDGVPASRVSDPLAPGAWIEVHDVPRSRLRPGGPGPEEGELAIVFEDEHLAVIDKPAGMVVHPSTVVQGGTLSERLVRHYGSLPCPQGEDRPGIVHRLDADTSGLIVVARSEQAAAGLVQRFRERTVEKRYLAIVHGVPRFDSDWIEAELARAKGRADRVRVVPDGEGREARTFYRTLRRFGRFALVEAQPHTGRTHQIRVHLASIDHPLVGDRVYRGRRGLARSTPRSAPLPRRHALHAAALAFEHPVTGAPQRFEAPLPEDLRALVAWLEEHDPERSA